MNPDWIMKDIELADIVLRGDVVKRTVDHEAVADLVDSIRESGLHTPIRVRLVHKYNSGVRSEQWELIAGRHRVEAAKILGWTRIPANVTDIDDDRAELAMIDENLMRKDLEPADLVYQTDRRKEVYERLHPETVHGSGAKAAADARWNADASRNNCDTHTSPERFTLATAKATGRSERSVQMAARIGKKLKDKAPLLVGTTLNSITELDALAGLDEKLRERVIERALRGEDVSAKAIAKEIQKAKPKRERKDKAAVADPVAEKDQYVAVKEADADADFFPRAEDDAGASPDRGDDEPQTAATDGIPGAIQSPEEAGAQEAVSDTVAPPWADEEDQFRALCRAWGDANGGARMRFLEWAGLSRH